MYASGILFTFRNYLESFFTLLKTVFAESIYMCMSSLLFSKNRFGRSFKTAYIQVIVLFELQVKIFIVFLTLLLSHLSPNK